MLVALDSLVAFARQVEDLYAFATRPPDVSFVLSFSFPFNCPDQIRDVKLKELATLIST